MTVTVPASVGALRSLGEPEENLARFMSHHGHAPDALVKQIATLFDELDMIFASGSVVVGYANLRSDVDLYAVGGVPDAQQVPVVSHELGPLLDITLVQRDELAQQLDWLHATEQVIAAGGAPAAKWRTASKALDRAGRFAYGVVLQASPSSAQDQEALRQGLLVDRAATWWRLESRRRLLTARWLERTKPALAAQLACEARLCALKAVTAAAGYVYYNQKFLAKELRALGRDDLLSAYRQALRAAWDPAVPVAEAAELVDRLIGPAPADLVVEAAYARGVATHHVGDATLVARWEMRGALVRGDELPKAYRDGRAIWTGALDEAPPEWLHRLANAGLVWLGVARAAKQ